MENAFVRSLGFGIAFWVWATDGTPQEAQSAGVDSLRLAQVFEWPSEGSSKVNSTPETDESGFTMGYDKGLYAEQEDQFRLKLNGTLQIGYRFGDQREGGSESGFENRRTTLRLSGFVIDPSWTYLIQGIFAGGSGNFVLLDGVIAKKLGERVTVRAGKFRFPFLQEQLRGYGTMLAVERTLFADVFGIGRSQGVEVVYQGEGFQLSGAFGDGQGGIGGTTDFAFKEAADFAFTGRGEFLLSGKASEFNDYVAWPGGTNGTKVGAAVHYQEGFIGNTMVEGEVFRWTIDFACEVQPWSLLLTLAGNHADPDDASELIDQRGLTAHLGHLLGESSQVFAIYEYGEGDSAGRDLNILTVGFTQFFAGHRAKLTTDIGYAFEPLAALFANDAKGWRTDPFDDDGQLVFRMQLQLAF